MNHRELVASIIVKNPGFFWRATNGLNGLNGAFSLWITGHQTPLTQKAYLIYRPCFASRNSGWEVHFHERLVFSWLTGFFRLSSASSQRRIRVQRPIAPGRACQTILRTAQLLASKSNCNHGYPFLQMN